MKNATRALTLGVATVAAGLMIGGTAYAGNPSGQAQPNQSCQDLSASPNGFGTAGFAHAETVYAGSDGTASALHAHSSTAVSQYDVACYQLSSH